MASKRIIVSLRDEERVLLLSTVKYMLKNLPQAPADTSPGLGISILKTNLEKLEVKLNGKQNRDDDRTGRE